MLTKERIDKHALQAVDCPPATWVVLRSAMHRLVDKESAAVAERDARIAELEKDCDRLERYWNEAMATHKNIAELERQLAEARKDAELLDYIQTNGATVEIIPGAPDFYPVHFRVGGRYRTANENIRDAIRAAIKEQT